MNLQLAAATKVGRHNTRGAACCQRRTDRIFLALNLSSKKLFQLIKRLQSFTWC